MASVRPLSYNVPGADLPSGQAASSILQANASMVRPRIGGRRRRTSRRGGFYPAVMSSLTRSGSYLFAPVASSAYKLLNRKSKRKSQRRRHTRRSV